MSLSIVIVDDEQLARDELAFLLRDVEGIDVLAQGKNGPRSGEPDPANILPTWCFWTCRCRGWMALG